MKNIFNKKTLLKRYLIYRHLITFKNVQQKKLTILKKEKLFKPFPSDKINVTIKQYPFQSKIDKFYLDFYYSVNSVANPDYIPASTYLLNIEPVLNNIYFSKNIDNKSMYDKILHGISTPVTLLRKINNFFYDRNYQPVDISETYLSEITRESKKLILKASVDSGAGKNILIFNSFNGVFINDKIKLSEEFLKNYPDFVLQEFVDQHPFFKQFNPGSNNTVRVLVYKSVKDNSIHVLHCLLRIGKSGSFTDHDNLGGIVVGISPEGFLNNFGCNVNGIRFSTFNGVAFDKIDRQVPFIREIREMAEKIADQVYYARLLAIDFTVDNHGNPLLLEINSHGNGTCQYQMNNGPLFQEFTREILDFCAQNDRKLFMELQ